MDRNKIINLFLAVHPLSLSYQCWHTCWAIRQPELHVDLTDLLVCLLIILLLQRHRIIRKHIIVIMVSNCCVARPSDCRALLPLIGYWLTIWLHHQQISLSGTKKKTYTQPRDLQTQQIHTHTHAVYYSYARTRTYDLGLLGKKHNFCTAKS